MLFFMMLSLDLFSQSHFTVKSGKPAVFTKGGFSKLMDFDNQFYYFLRLNDKTQLVFNSSEPPAIEVFDKQFDYVRSIPIVLSSEIRLKKAEPVAFYKMDSGFIFLLKSYTTVSQLMRSYLFTTDEKGLLTGEMLIPGDVNDVLPSVAEYNFFQLNRVSHNEHDLFVFSVKTPPEMDVNERVNLVIFNENLTREGERLINFPDDILNYKFSDLVFGTSGMVFFRVEITNPYLLDKTVHQLVVYNLFTDTNQSLEFKFAEGEIAQAKLVRMNDAVAAYYGYFTNNEEDKQIRGIFYYLFNLEDGSLINHNIFTLSDDALEKFNPKNLFSKSDYQHLIPAEIKQNQSGSIFLLFEYNWQSMMLIRDQEGKVYNQKVYNANEVFVLEFDSLDRFRQALVIPKEQTNGFEQSGLGIYAHVVGDDLFILFNDHPKNITQYDASKLKTMKMDYEAVIATCTFEEAGYQKNPLLRSGFPVKLEPASIFRVPDSSLLLLQEGQKNLVEIRFGEK